MTVPVGVLASSVVTSGVTSTGLTLPAVTTGNFQSTPDSPDVSAVDDLMFMFDGALTDWTPTSSGTLMAKDSGGAGGRTFTYRVSATTGKLFLLVSANGTATTFVESAVAPTVADLGFLATGVARRASDGRTQFWTAPTGTSTFPGGVGWTQLGGDVTSATVGSLFDSSTALTISAAAPGNVLLRGTPRRARMWASIDGTDERFDANFVGVTVFGTRNPASIVDAAKGATVTCNGSAWDWAV